jgi:hypothetical protein
MQAFDSESRYRAHNGNPSITPFTISISQRMVPLKHSDRRVFRTAEMYEVRSDSFQIQKNMGSQNPESNEMIDVLFLIESMLVRVDEILGAGLANRDEA